MNQREWHSLLREHALDELRQHWPEVAVKGPWIIARNHGPFCWTIGWEAMGPRRKRLVSNYAKIHIDFSSRPTSAVTDLNRILGEKDQRQDWVRIQPDDPSGQAEAAGILVRRMIDEAVPFFDHIDSAEAMREFVVQQGMDVDKVRSLDRLEVVAGLTVLEECPEAAAPWYEQAMDLANELLAELGDDWLRDQTAWLDRCHAAATGQTDDVLTDLFAERGAAYRSRGTLPARN
ncbi:MAG: hypothetical protein AAF467_25105 [Actinomycetota bacterium]